MKRAKADSHRHKIKGMMDHIKEIINILIRISTSLITIIKMITIQEEVETINTKIQETIKKKTINNFKSTILKKMNIMTRKEIIIIMNNIIKAASQNKRMINIIINITQRTYTSQNLKMIIEIKIYISLKDGKDPMCCLLKLKENFKNSLKYFKKTNHLDNFQGCK